LHRNFRSGFLQLLLQSADGGLELCDVLLLTTDEQQLLLM
jgi:hypothetical protein